MTSQNVRVAAAAALLCAGLTTLIDAPAQAGFVDLPGGWTAEWDESLNGLVDVTGMVVGNVLFIEKSAEFTNAPVGDVFDPIDIVFTQTAADALGSIVIDDEIILNSTGADWLDFHIELIGDAAVFDDVMTAAAGGTSPIGWSVSPFTDAAFTPDLKRLDISGGVVADGASWFPGLSGQLWMDVATGDGATTPFASFTLRETPTIPAPGALTVLALGMLACRRRRR